MAQLGEIAEPVGWQGETEMNDQLHIALIQDNPIVGDINGNTDLALEHVRRNADADLVVFSECFVSGYPLGDLALRPGFIASVEVALAKISAVVREMEGPAVLIGAPMAGARLPYNAAFLIEPGGATRVVRKRELPNNDVFNEHRIFARAEDAPLPLQFRGFSLGVQICEDMWHGAVSRGLADELADILIVLNGSPYQRGKQRVRLRHARSRVASTGLPLMYVNQVGGQDELVFDGGTFIMNADGTSAGGAAFVPAHMRAVLRREVDGSVRIGLDQEPVGEPHPEDGIASDYAACVLGLRDYVAKTGSPRVFVGVSGGLDSALVLAMAVDALGAERVHGVMLPTRHTSEESLNLANDLMLRLGVVPRSFGIEEAFKVLDRDLGQFLDETGADIGVAPQHMVTRENYQSRLRGVALMGMTNALGGILLSTGNKSEMSVGYATLYGDMNGGFNPLKSVYKSKAFRMAEWRNATSQVAGVGPVGREVIPDRIIKRPPTAELADGQTDQASLGSYEILDVVLEALVETRSGPDEVARLLEARFGLEEVIRLTGGSKPAEYAMRIAQLVARAQYKRAQACPGVKLNETDFGSDWQYPIAGRGAL